MPILVGLVLVLLLALILGPHIWVRRALARHGGDRPDLPGTGGELARHLLDEAGLNGIAVEETDLGDHYDPETRTVRLMPQHFRGRSVAAVAVATHEVGHALQHARGERGFARRTQVVKRAIWIDRIAIIIVLTAPLLALFLNTPTLMLMQFVLGLTLLLVNVAVHVVTLPVEFDASFGKALPIIEQGRYLPAADIAAAREVLRAAAFTYVAAALATLLDVARWFRIIRL